MNSRFGVSFYCIFFMQTLLEACYRTRSQSNAFVSCRLRYVANSYKQTVTIILRALRPTHILLARAKIEASGPGKSSRWS